MWLGLNGAQRGRAPVVPSSGPPPLAGCWCLLSVVLSVCSKRAENREGQTAQTRSREDGDGATETCRGKAREQQRGKREEEGKGGRGICHAHCTAEGNRGGKTAERGQAGG